MIDLKKVLTKKEKEELVLDLYFNQNKTFKEIAKILRMSLRDIKIIVDKAVHEKERKEHKSLDVQAYELFSKHKKPLEAAIELNIGQAQATQYYEEYLKLIGLMDVTKIYLEFKDNVPYFVTLCKAAKAAKMGVPQVVEVLKIANNYLPAVQRRYEVLRKENNTLESNLRTAAKEFQSLNNMISSMNNTLDGIKLQCGTEAATLEYLQQQRAKLETFVYNFRNDDEGYTKLKKTIEDEVLRILSDKKALLKQAALSITESIRKNPQKYGPLLTAGDSHLPQNLYAETLLEESEKIYSSLTELFVREVVTENVSKQPTVTASPPALRQQNDVPAEDKY